MGRVVTVFVAIMVVVFVGASLQPVVLRAMRTHGVMDTPNERSSHTRPTPRGGGIAVVVGATAGLLTVPQVAAVLLLPLLGFGLLGLAEDIKGVPVRIRLICQGCIGLASGVSLLIGRVPLVELIVVAAGIALWCVAYVNAFNFMDGVNGVSAAHTIVGGIMFGILGTVRSNQTLLVGGVVLAAAAAAFLPWNNAWRATIFLGDVGSYGLGGAFGIMSVFAVLNGVPLETAVAPLAVYLVDTGWTLVRRVRAGEVWYEAHRSHIYQRLTNLGWSHSQVTIGTAALAAGVSGCGLASLTAGTPVRIGADAVAGLLLVAYLLTPELSRGRIPVEVTR